MDRESTRPVLVPIKGGLNPAYLLIPVVLGLVIGLGFGLKDRITGNRVDRDQTYILLASTLYGQNPTQETAAELRQRLGRLGIAEPSYTVLKLADNYETSRDADLQAQAGGLRIFGQALGGVTAAPVKIPTPSVTPTATVALAAVTDPARAATPTFSEIARAAPSVTATPTVPIIAVGTPTTLVATPDASTILTPTGPTTTATPPRSPTATAKKTATKTPTPLARSATVSTGTTQNVYLREGPYTNKAVIVTIPNGSKVTVLRAVTGEAITRNSSRWYVVKWTNRSGKVYQGYVYGLLVSF